MEVSFDDEDVRYGLTLPSWKVVETYRTTRKPSSLWLSGRKMPDAGLHRIAHQKPGTADSSWWMLDTTVASLVRCDPERKKTSAYTQSVYNPGKDKHSGAWNVS
ncbi:hypothetical protein RvY_16366 [Ramazzottius varieornatus]|uniref:Uncharacterized protein n=1 Tax=Ramazzottius varieornatus TaxID=947166 RepID=A0A1D1VY59_RAMVA|nr:hypothetical protein RvY_16366 [Ramazzottius varieornatus]